MFQFNKERIPTRTVGSTNIKFHGLKIGTIKSVYGGIKKKAQPIKIIIEPHNGFHHMTAYPMIYITKNEDGSFHSINCTPISFITLTKPFSGICPKICNPITSIIKKVTIIPYISEI
jgi:hypothetical protein